MSERCILAVRFTPAGTLGQVRKAVGGFLRYVQHRDLHPADKPAGQSTQVAGLLKYVAYRDQASARAELLGPSGTLGSSERKAFAAYVVRSLEDSLPQLYLSRDGLVDRRRAVYRIVISPERAQGLDLRELTTAAVRRLEKEAAVEGIRWMAAIHRNTAHPHVHLVIAGMRRQGQGFARLDLTKPRLAAMKEQLVLEIGRQRELRAPALVQRQAAAPQSANERTRIMPRFRLAATHRHAVLRWRRTNRLPALPLASFRHRHAHRGVVVPAISHQLQAAARRYRHQMHLELEDELERRQREGWVR